MSEDYVVISLVVFVAAIFLISFIVSAIEGEINE
jgi:hypothetical protein